MKRVNQKEYQRLEKLVTELSDRFADPDRRSHTIWRGDVRAIQWAAWWIRESIAEAHRKAPL